VTYFVYVDMNMGENSYRGADYLMCHMQYMISYLTISWASSLDWTTYSPGSSKG